MTNAPTTTAITPKKPRKIVRNDSACWMSFWVSSVICSPVITCTPASEPSPSRMASTTSVWDTPSSAATEIELTLPGSPSWACASSTVHMAKLAPPGLSAVPNRAMPDSVNSLVPARVCTGTVSPTS